MMMGPICTCGFRCITKLKDQPTEVCEVNCNAP